MEREPESKEPEYKLDPEWFPGCDDNWSEPEESDSESSSSDSDSEWLPGCDDDVCSDSDSEYD